MSTLDAATLQVVQRIVQEAPDHGWDWLSEQLYALDTAPESETLDDYFQSHFGIPDPMPDPEAAPPTDAAAPRPVAEQVGEKVDVRHEWTPRPGERGVWDCPHCKQWTANKPLYARDVCPARDRRSGRDRRRHAEP